MKPLSFEAGILKILQREMGPDLLKWPVPPMSRPRLLFDGDNRAIESTINRALALAGQPEIGAGFRRRFHAVPATHPQQQIHPAWWWSRWSSAMGLEFKDFSDLCDEIAVAGLAEEIVSATAAPKAERKTAVSILRAVRPYIAHIHEDLLDSNSLPRGEEGSLAPDVAADRAKVAELLKDIDAGIENPADDFLQGGAAAEIRRILNEAGVPQAAFIDDQVMIALWQRDRAREAIVDIFDLVRAPVRQRDVAAGARRIIEDLVRTTPNV